MPTCYVTGVILTVTGAPARGAVVATWPEIEPGRPGFAAGGEALSQQGARAVTDELGRFALTLVRGARVVVRCEAIGLARQLTVPDREEITFKELIDADV
jgi:hypothetical protein